MKVELYDDQQIKTRTRICPTCRRLFLADLDDSYSTVRRCKHWKTKMNMGEGDRSREFIFLND